MFTKKEITWVIITILIMSFIIGFTEEFTVTSILIAFIIISTSLIAKKLASKYFYVEIQHEMWKFRRYGFLERSRFKKPFPIGIVLPFLMTIFSLGLIRPLTFLEFKSKSSKLRILRTRGVICRTLDVKESDLGLISAAGFWGLLFLSFLGILLGIPMLIKYPVYYALWNLIPVSNLDGAKLFFGSFFNWVLLTVLNLIFLIGILLM